MFTFGFCVYLIYSLVKDFRSGKFFVDYSTNEPSKFKDLMPAQKKFHLLEFAYIIGIPIFFGVVETAVLASYDCSLLEEIKLIVYAILSGIVFCVSIAIILYGVGHTLRAIGTGLADCGKEILGFFKQ